ncbi:hypothetical protein [Haloquadratum walsbyi]|nr:hypothetical protein [Haloquadratum walsbyi]
MYTTEVHVPLSGLSRPGRAHLRPDAESYSDIHRQAYNYTRYDYQTIDTETANIGSASQHHTTTASHSGQTNVRCSAKSTLVQSTASNRTVKRFYSTLSGFSELKQNGQAVGIGMLRWKPPREFRSLT